MTDHVSIFAPATVANVGPGFDVFGFALEGAGDTVDLRKSPSPGVRITSISGDGGRLPLDAERNAASAVVARMLREAGADFGAVMRLRKGIPLESGMGSSSASSVAGAVAANALLNDKFNEARLLEFCRFGESVACGTGHADNVAPALLGGFILIRKDERGEEIVRLKAPGSWRAVVVHPRLSLSTREARRVLPKQVTLSSLTGNLSNAAAVIAALMNRDLGLFGRAMMGDGVVEPARQGLIAHYPAVKRAGLAAGAKGVVISGAGPSVFALVANSDQAREVGKAIARAWKTHGVQTDIFISRIGARGAHAC